MKNIKNYTEEQLERVSGMWLVRAKELQWKANKMKARLEKRLEREGKRHASLEPTRELLSNSKIILEALLPHGESKALDLVREQITACEAKIHDVTYRYNLLSDEEIALKYMDLELAQMRAEKARTAKTEVEAELASRALVAEPAQYESIETEPQRAVQSSVAKALNAISSKKMELELSILKTLRQAPNALARLRSYRNSGSNVNLLRLKTGLEKAGGMFRVGQLRMAG